MKYCASGIRQCDGYRASGYRKSCLGKEERWGCGCLWLYVVVTGEEAAEVGVKGVPSLTDCCAIFSCSYSITLLLELAVTV